MSNDEVKEYERMWTLDRERYVLVKPDPKGYSEIPRIYDVIDCFGIFLEDDSLAATIVGHMLAAGVPLVDETPPGINPVTQTQLDMIEAGASADEINRAVAELRRLGIGQTNPLFSDPTWGGRG
ncbi:MAG: hypothetical protein KDB14_11445 [Planctomycetales bacterium]|nr:hypothetical protein [Planctomycetales bacterium]